MNIWEMTSAGIMSKEPLRVEKVWAVGQLQSDLRSSCDPPSKGTVLRAEIRRPFPTLKLSLFISPNLRDRECFRPLLLWDRAKSKQDTTLSHLVNFVGREDIATIALHLANDGNVGIKPMSSRECLQEIPRTIPLNEAELRKALTAIANFYFHRDRTNPELPGGDMHQASRFSLEMHKVVRSDDGGWLPASKNLIEEKDGQQVVAVKVTDPMPGEEPDLYGFTFHNNSDQAVFPYLFYLELPTFGISEWCSLTYLAQIHGNDIQDCLYSPQLVMSEDNSVKPGETLAIRYGSSGLNPLPLTSPFNLELGYLKLFLSTVEVAELTSLIQQPGLTSSGKGKKQDDDSTLPPGGDFGDSGRPVMSGTRGFVDFTNTQAMTEKVMKNKQPFWNCLTVSVQLQKERSLEATSLIL